MLTGNLRRIHGAKVITNFNLKTKTPIFINPCAEDRDGCTPDKHRSVIGDRFLL
jgi:hypothetical protein